MFQRRWNQKPPLGVRINPAHPLSKGLVGCWLLREGSGDKSYDLSGRSNTLTLVNMAFPPSTISGWNPSRDGVSLSFDGNNDRCTGPSYTILGGNVYTVCARIRFDEIASIEVALSFYKSFLGSTSANDWRWQVNDLGAEAITCDLPRVNGRWYDYCVTSVGIAAGQTKLYTDGIHRDNADNIGVISEGSLTLGCQEFKLPESGPARFMLGLIEFVYIYANRALTAQEVLELHENPYGMFEWPLILPAEAAPPPTRVPRSPAVSGVPSAHF